MDINVGRPLAGSIVTIGAAVAVASGLALPAHALVIIPYFENSITAAADASQVELSIESAIGTIESLFTNTGTVGIAFEQASGSFLGESESDDYTLSYANYVSALTSDSAAHPSNTVLSTAVANLSQGNDASGTTSIVATSALLRVGLGISANPCFDSGGNAVIACGGTSFARGVVDGIVTLSTSHTFFFTPSGYSSGEYNATETFEHEIDEILGGGGQGSVLNAIQQGYTAYGSVSDPNYYGPLDLYRYSAPGTPSFTTDGSATSYFSVNGGTTDIVGFNQQSNGDYADFSASGDVQSAFTGTGSDAPYTTATPEFAMMESIGYDGVTTTPEPATVALLAPAIAALRFVRRRRAVKAPAAARSPTG
jgi:hypothetical protein